MNAHGLRKCIQERETMALKYGEMEKYCAKMERECMLYERDLEKIMESCDELEKDNNELRAQLQDNSSSLCAEVKALQEDKENLLINLQRAEEEVKMLYEDNRLLDEENKRLLTQLRREKKRNESGCKHSATSSSVRGKRKTILWQESAGSPLGREGDFNMEEQLREALTPLHHNSPESRILKK
ncbi:hypothetical protein KSP40_PGU014585 [Platanthera guangdongensis]|uniref:Uncharacterized protein n=1 Tax=Platanthera guangdongensis TaxID=2320717 RepID=A0ABR2MBJ1_9ASPA